MRSFKLSGTRLSLPLALSAAVAFTSFATCTTQPAEEDPGGTGGEDSSSTGGKGTGGKATGGTGGKATGGTGGKGTGGSGSGGSDGTGGSGSGTGGSGSGTGGTPGTGGSSSGTGGTPGTGGTSGAKITANGCAGGACLNPTCKALGTPAPIGDFAELGFEQRPMYIPNDVVIPTYDDAPDGAIDPNDPTAAGEYLTYGKGTWTQQIVSWLDANGLHAEFFMNSNNWCGDVLQAADCVATVANILKTQNGANHTVHHMHLGGMTQFDPMDLSAGSCGTAPNSMVSCEDELKGVDEMVAMVSNGGVPNLTRFRAPYGEPFQVGGGAIADIKKVAKKYGVHIGWSFDTQDSKCDSGVPPCVTGSQIADGIKNFLGTAPGQGTGWGIILMHSTYPWTYDATKLVFDPKAGYIKSHGFKLGTVEDAVCWKYGKHSWEIVKELSGINKVPN